MALSPTTADRRSAVKERHRQAIVAAARRLIDERRGPRFSVDDLAAAADVSRRTVFNHFDSLDAVILAACTEILDTIVAAFRETSTAACAGDPSLGAMVDEIATALRECDLADRIAYLWQALGGADAPLAREQQFMQIALSRVAEDLTAEAVERHPDVDHLDVELLVAVLLNGTAVIADRWLHEHGGATDEPARRAWDALLDRLVLRTRTGFAADG